MSDWLRLAVVLLVIVDPLTAAVAGATLTADRDGRARSIVFATGTVVALAVVVVTAWLADPMLDALEVSVGAAQLAAGIVLLVPAVELLFGGPSGWVRPAPEAAAARLGAIPFGVPVLASPWLVVALLAFAADEGAAMTASAGGVAVLVSTGLAFLFTTPSDRGALRALGVAMGAATALVAFDLVHDGVFGS